MYRVAQIPLVLADDPPEDRLRLEFLSFARTGFRRCDKIALLLSTPIAAPRRKWTIRLFAKEVLIRLRRIKPVTVS
jgi:hypothetical protein